MHAADPQPAESEPTPRPSNRRVKTPTVLQMEAVECGAAALAIVLGSFGRIVPLEKLREECGVSRDGSKASNILRAARDYGLVAKGFKYELEDLYDVELPAILFWNANHFVVLEGFKKGKVYLNDPGPGPRVITHEELDASYSGVVLTFEKGPDFQPGGEKRSLTAALGRRLGGYETALAYMLLCGLFLVVPGLLVPTFQRIFVDEFLVGGRGYLVRPLLIGMALTALIRMALTWLQEYYLLRFETKLSLSTSSRFFQHLLRLPAAYFSQRYAGEIGSRVMINDKVANALSDKLTATVIDCGLIVFYGAIMLTYDVALTLLVVVLAAGNVVALKLVSRSRTDASRRLLADKGRLMGTAMNGLAMIETLKSTGGESEFFGRWSGYQAKSLRSEQALQVRSDLVNIVPATVTMLITAAVLLVGGFKVMNGELTVGLLVAYQTLTGFFTKPLGNFVSFGAVVQELEGDMNRLDDVLRYPQDVVYERGSQRPAGLERKLKLDGKVELIDITFGYSPLEKPLIEGFSLTIQPGQRVALVGGSGSGKSTVARLVSGLYQPWSGQILFDGVPVEELPRDLLANSIGMVDQEVFLFGGTIRDNISMWDATIPAARLTTAARDAAIARDIEMREGSYDAAVAEGGGNFSGGQRQRLEIARALVAEPSVLILDEATSALDPATEVTVMDSLRRRGCTCIIIAHRLSTIRDCDEIVVMERGRIVQRGTHDEMKEQDGPYAKLMEEH